MCAADRTILPTWVNPMEGNSMFSKILVAVGGPEDAEEVVPVVTGLAKAFDSEVLVVHMRERVVTAAATVEKETIPQAFRFAEQLVEAGVKASADIRGHRPDRLADFVLDEAKKFFWPRRGRNPPGGLGG